MIETHLKNIQIKILKHSLPMFEEDLQSITRLASLTFEFIDRIRCGFL